MAAASVFAGKLTNVRRLNTVKDAEGNEIEVDIREDEEQSNKLADTVDLLVAAGYFRARIKGLSPFDKVVGGMTWCITTCNYDVDVDLLFEENSTIGQKISLTEKIVAVLPLMKCPHRIEPHQIQGLDFIHIYPVIQWLVKRAIETREEIGDYVRAYAVSQFDKMVERPKRKYRRQDPGVLTEEDLQVQSTLLEYGHRYTLARRADDGKDVKGADHGDDTEDSESEKIMSTLMSSMAEASTTEEKIAASAVGTIVDLQSAEIRLMASQYRDKQAELAESTNDRKERLGGTQHYKRVKQTLEKQIEDTSARLQKIKLKHGDLESAYMSTKAKLDDLESHGTKLEEESIRLHALETEENAEILEKLRSLVAVNEDLKKQEKEFKLQCKEEMARLKADIEKVRAEGVVEDEDPEYVERVESQYQADREKLHKIRLLLARKNREISALQRKIDEVPSRAELSQYQRRFVELYNQMNATHRETKQFYTLYNTLDDTKMYRNKEVNLLNSIHDNFSQAMASPVTREAFLKQFEQIVDGVRQNRHKLESKKQEEKMRRDQLNDEHLDLLEKQRLYYKTVSDFTEECRKNEILLTKLNPH